MLHETVEPLLESNDRPQRDTIIQKDDIISLKIDLNLLSVDGFIQKYCAATSTAVPPVKITFHRQ